jgi:integrase
MSRPSRGARLYLKPEERTPEGKLRKRAVWVIQDGPSRIVTGCAREDRAGAEEKLRDHLAEKYRPGRDSDGRASEILVTDVLAIYQTDVVPSHARPGKTDERILELGRFWAGKTLAEVNGKTCRRYAELRAGQPWKSARPERTSRPARLVTSSGARRELEDLRAAINHHRREGYCREIVEVVLPPKGEARSRWLTRSEVAGLLWACWRTTEVQQGKATLRRPLRHIARFILVGVYTGTRASAICSAAIEPTEGRGWVDVDGGVFYRRPIGRRETKKRQTPVRLPSRLHAHIRRWKDTKKIQHSLVQRKAGAIGEIGKGFARAVELAGLGPDVTPHILRHTCATWMMQNGADLWSAAGFLGMTVEQLERTYGHHHPDHQKSAAKAVEAKKERAPKPASKVVRLGGQ